MVRVTQVEKHSLGQQHGILVGDFILSINGHPIMDVLDYRFYLAESTVTLQIHRGEQLFDCTIQKSEYEDIGLDFSTFLMDEKHTCKNKCIFCFIDQLPRGMRQSLYFKDDDSRLSFLMGNYITLTNLKEEEIDRIIQMKTSPLHISVHTTDPALRVEMMKNPKAAECFSLLKRFAQASISLHAQIVLCRDYNDKEALDRTMRDLASLSPQMESVSIVPAGLTDHREGLCPLRSFDQESAFQTVKQVEAFANECLEKYGSRIFFCSDEFYLKANLPLPAEEDYEGYPQLENGVGMMTSMRTEFLYALENMPKKKKYKKRQISIATGVSAHAYISDLVKRLCERIPTLSVHVYCIENRFFGKEITVAGLLCGQDLIAQLKNQDLGQALLLPAVTLRHEKDLFLDSVSVQEVQQALNVPIKFVENDGMALMEALLGHMER